MEVDARRRIRLSFIVSTASVRAQVRLLSPEISDCMRWQGFFGNDPVHRMPGYDTGHY